jgi:23S rRNA C2498 (ribose-2'-O)-methylase RlmM
LADLVKPASVVLRYLDRKVNVDVFLPMTDASRGINASIHTNQLVQDIEEVPVYLRSLVAQSWCLV